MEKVRRYSYLARQVEILINMYCMSFASNITTHISSDNQSL